MEKKTAPKSTHRIRYVITNVARMYFTSHTRCIKPNPVVLPHFALISPPGRERILWFCDRAVSECSLCHSSHCWRLGGPHRRTASAVASRCRKGGGGCFLPTPGKPRPCYTGMCRGSGASSNRFGSAGNPGSAAGRAEGGARRGDGAGLAELLRRGQMAAQSKRADPHPGLLLQRLRTQRGRARQERRREEKEAEVLHSLDGTACVIDELKHRLNSVQGLCVFEC